MAKYLNDTGIAYFWGKITARFASKDNATQSAAGLMSATDKAKLDGIASGAQVNSITGVKGSAESSYRTGYVNLTPVNIGAQATRCSASLDNCSTVEELYTVLLANNGAGRGNVGTQSTNNFKTLVGDPGTGGSSVAAFVYIDCFAATNEATLIHMLVVGNNGFKHKYVYRHPNPDYSRQTEWAAL